MWDSTLIIALLLMGCVAGFLAGLLGIGGGMVVVPVVLWVLHHLAPTNMHSQQLALGTSFAVMSLTMLASMVAQYRRHNIRMDVLPKMAPALIGGALLGASVTRFLPSRGLQLFFIVFAYVMAVQALTNYKPKATRHLPDTAGMAGAGGAIGCIASWVGVGGGGMLVPFFLYCNVSIRQAIGTSTALGWCVAVTGTLGYVMTGWTVSGLPTGSVGFCYWPVAAVMALATVSLAPVGVRVGSGCHKMY
ncbi:sulfite exporter TauE/SafE family protein [Snodgrassella sp. CFCC 13594]|uniref:sulfite exporter TauE/SafE family protein n=1 Tax=Snodgrassella sp. CFCC 13594 TaxID=1775559 RepID=UPI0009EEBAE8|nr:sulfite exporter TauE/SafE family protein [Snodgrassella sp. CFCC 13594]